MGVACPYCLIMLDDGAKAKGGELKVLDVAQVVARSTGADPTTGPEGPAAESGTTQSEARQGA